MSLLTFSLLTFHSRPAGAQAFQISQLNNQVMLHVDGDSPAPPPNVDVETNLAVFEFSQSESDSSTTDGTSANGSVSQIEALTLQSNVLYITCTTSASGSANASPLSIFGSDTEAVSVFSTGFKVFTPCYYIVQASTAYSGSEVNPYYHDGTNIAYTTNYPVCLASFSAGNAFVNAGLGFPANGTQATGTIDADVQGSIEVNTQASVQGFGSAGDDGLPYPLSASERASATVTVTIYPQSPPVGGTFPWQTNAPTLGINYDGTNVVLNWPDLYPNYLLTCATNPCSSNWSVVPVPPVIVGDQWQVNHGPPVGTQFFRLQGQ